MRAAEECPDCHWQTRVYVDAAPGGGDWVCKVCDLQAEINLINESRGKQHRLMLHALSDLQMLGMDISQIIGVDDYIIRQVAQYDRDGLSYS